MPDRKLILIVCSGNVCRSPMAEKLLQRALAVEAAPLDQIEVVSAGTTASYGDPASENTVAALRRVNIDIERHKSQPLTSELIERAFAIFGMTDAHLNALRYYHSGLPQRARLFREFIGEDEDDQIPDPFGQDFDAYKACMDAMIEAIPSIIAYLKNEYR